MSFEVRFTANSWNGQGVHNSIEPHATVQSAFLRAEQIIGRLGYDGNLRSLVVVIELPEMEALKASRDAINRAIGELEAQKFRQSAADA
jgi:hypothetical protein